SGCAKLGIAPHVTEAALNHRSGVIRGVARVYNRYDFGSEKRVAFEAWARYVEAIVTGAPAGNVVELASARASWWVQGLQADGAGGQRFRSTKTRTDSLWRY